MDLGEGLTGDPGDLGVKLCLGHVLLLSVRSQSVPLPGRRTGSGESAKQDREWGMEWVGRRSRLIARRDES